jgi:exodeoxyribonuclease V gamma subunit
MALTVSFVNGLHGIVEPVQQYLQRDLHQRDVFAPQVVVVPTIGVRSWLTPLLATSLGATDGRNDGIFANVNVQYVGYLQRMLRQAAGLASDPWERNRVNLATLQALDGFSETGRLEKKYNGRLNAARILAERFDRYATRRPELIRSWHRGVAALGDLSVEKYYWQFKLWERVRDIVGTAPWPVINAELCDRLRAGEKIPGIPDRLMIAGFESISPSNMEVIDALSNVIDVEMIFVHQSPYLRGKWNEMASGVVPNKAELPVPTNFAPLSASSLRLPPSWMQSSFDLELLLAAYGVRGEYATASAQSNSSSLLQVLQRGISGAPVNAPAEQQIDLSVQIHRAHNLARQVEVLHDALLHAFSEDKDLQPHDVVVLCADIQSAAPILEAVFDKTVSSKTGRNFKLPLVVADRTLKDVNDGADLASNLLNLVTSRFDLESFMLVATSPLVMKNFSVSASDVAVWGRHLENSRLRWGLDAEHREEHGLVAPELNAHGWLDAIERSLLGAVMKVGSEAPVMAGNVRPIPFVESSDTEGLITLVGVLSVLAEFEHLSRVDRSVEEWCVETEKTLNALCGESCAEIDEVLNVLNAFQRASHSLNQQNTSTNQTVPFAEFAEYVTGELTASSGRLPLRSGSITATSFVPLRTVPFKVVCVVGFDDGTLPMGEPEGDDLIAATPMLGDGDPKIESRRVFLDALMSAEQSFIVTCTGRSIKNNKPVPLITPLNEFLDFCRACGVEVPEDADKLSAVEYSHPRHLGSPENFQVSDGPVPQKIWSHDNAALLAAKERLAVRSARVSDDEGMKALIALPDMLKEITLPQLEDLVLDPLRHFLQFGLKIRTEWSADDVSNVLPLFVEGKRVERLCREAFLQRLDDTEFEAILRSADVLPISPFDDVEVAAAQAIVKEYRTKYEKDLPSQAQAVEIHLGFAGLPTVIGQVDGYHSAEKTVSFVSFSKTFTSDYARMIVRALALIADGNSVDSVLMFHLSGNGKSTTKRKIEIDEAITKEVALEKIAALLALEPIGRSIACPLFGDASQTLFGVSNLSDDERLEAAEDQFDEFVAGDYTYPNSKELVVYGASPDFETVYKDESGRMATFYTALFDVTKAVTVKHGSTGGWRLMK